MKSKKTKLFLVLLDGPMGAGKTTVAKLLHEKLKRTAHIGLDRIKWFISDFKRIPADNEIVRNVAAAMTREYLQNGISVIVEQGMRKDYVLALKKIAKKQGARFLAYHLDAPKALLLERIKQRPAPQHKPGVSKARIERNYRAHLENKYTEATAFNTEKLSASKIANLILKDIKE